MPGYRSIDRPDLLAGQVIVVTGGGSGIGRCTAHELASLGAAVAIIGRRVEKLAAVQDEITSAGGSCSIDTCDIREEESLRQTIADVLERHGRIDALVNNAGGQFPAPLASVAPGWIASSGMDSYPPLMRDTIRGMHKLVPLRRLGTESEVAAAITFLLSPAAAFISGACLRLDGAAPNAKRIWPEVGTGGSTSAFDGFHLARTPQVLQGD